jgi:DNA-binding NtrC family response regulator
VNRVLVVDDESSVCQSVVKVLTRRGFVVDEATCVAAAVETLERGERYSVVIADLMMPGESGVDLLKRVRTDWPDVPVLLITGYASVSSAVEAMQHGAAGYLPKPFTPEELEGAVAAVLARCAPPGDDEEDARAEGVITLDVS